MQTILAFVEGHNLPSLRVYCLTYLQRIRGLKNDCDTSKFVLLVGKFELFNLLQSTTQRVDNFWNSLTKRVVEAHCSMFSQLKSIHL